MRSRTQRRDISLRGLVSLFAMILLSATLIYAQETAESPTRATGENDAGAAAAEDLRKAVQGWYLSASPIITPNWEATSGNVWTVPVGGGVGRVMKLGFQPVNITAQFYGNAVHPAGTSSWGMRLQIAFLFPKLSKRQENLIMEQKLKQLEKETTT